jgi:hypothetical protein
MGRASAAKAINMKSWKEMSGDEKMAYLKAKILQGGWAYSESEWGWIKAHNELLSLHNHQKQITKSK